eukprot:scaffold149397_cov16-Tisochrysis_lutea.AAC.1
MASAYMQGPSSQAKNNQGSDPSGRSKSSAAPPMGTTTLHFSSPFCSPHAPIPLQLPLLLFLFNSPPRSSSAAPPAPCAAPAASPFLLGCAPSHAQLPTRAPPSRVSPAHVHTHVRPQLSRPGQLSVQQGGGVKQCSACCTPLAYTQKASQQSRQRGRYSEFLNSESQQQQGCASASPAVEVILHAWSFLSVSFLWREKDREQTLSARLCHYLCQVDNVNSGKRMIKTQGKGSAPAF